MKLKQLILPVVAIVSVGIAYASYSHSAAKSEPSLIFQNIEALTDGESGARCPNGCSDIGWGTHKILECDCNYDHWSSCAKWGC